MNYMEKVAEMLGVELGEEFKIEGVSTRYILTEDGLFSAHYPKEKHSSSFVMILSGAIEIKKLPYRPKDNNIYYFPDFNSNKGYAESCWTNHYADVNRYNRVGCYRTKEEAIEKAKELGWV